MHGIRAVTRMVLRPSVVRKPSFFCHFSTARKVPDNLIRVRVWQSGYHDENGNFVKTTAPKAIMHQKTGRDSNVGHVSIETQLLYASLWPEGYVEGKFKPVPGMLMPNSIADTKAEKREPDKLIDFTSLNARFLEKEFKQFTTKKPIQWTLMGGNKWLNNNEAESCSGLAYRLLLAAGIKTLVPTKHLIRDIIISTPNNIADLIEEAKMQEDLKLPIKPPTLKSP